MDRGAWRAIGSQRVQHNLVTNSSTGYYMQLACRCFPSLLTGALSTVFCPSRCSTWQGQPLGAGGIHRRSCARDSHLCPPATPTFRASPSGGDWKNHSHLFIQLTFPEHLVCARLSFVAPRGQLGARQRGLPLRALLCSSGETDSKQVNRPAKQDGFSISVMEKMKQGAALEGGSHFFFFLAALHNMLGWGSNPYLFNTKSILYWGMAG